jgi:hypothetical protein
MTERPPVAVDPKRFWDIIACIAPLEDPEEREEALEKLLAGLPPDDILGFYLRYDACADAAWREDLACVARLTHWDGDQRCDEQDLFWFVNWLIEQGLPVYESALRDPDSLADVTTELEWVCDDAWDAVEYAWNLRTGETGRQLSERLEGIASGPKDLPEGCGVVSEADLRRRFPRLARRFIDGERP